MAFQHIFRHVFRHGLARATGDKVDVSTNEVKAGTEWHDAIAITGAAIAMGAVALGIGHTFNLDGDVCFDVLTICGIHPVSRAFKVALLAIF